jgi:hypothetical protein
MPQGAHHRRPYRSRGPEARWLTRKAYHLMKLIGSIHASARLERELEVIGVGIYRCPPATMSKWRATLADALPYAKDTTGEIWR